MVPGLLIFNSQTRWFTYVIELYESYRPTISVIWPSRVLAGKDYEKGMRAHKITFQAVWEILMPQCLQLLRKHNHELKEKTEDTDSKDSYDSLMSLFTTESF